VVAAGTWSEVDTGGAMTRSVPFTDPLGSFELNLSVVASSPGLLGAVRGTLATGATRRRPRRARRSRRRAAGAASRLGIDRVGNLPAVFVGERAFAVIGRCRWLASGRWRRR
jgi:putative ABC transport system permease protein